MKIKGLIEMSELRGPSRLTAQATPGLVHIGSAASGSVKARMLRLGTEPWQSFAVIVACVGPTLNCLSAYRQLGSLKVGNSQWS